MQVFILVNTHAQPRTENKTYRKIQVKFAVFVRASYGEVSLSLYYEARISVNTLICEEGI